jgi:hypothetical protein
VPQLFGPNCLLCNTFRLVCAVGNVHCCETLNSFSHQQIEVL